MMWQEKELLHTWLKHFRFLDWTEFTSVTIFQDGQYIQLNIHDNLNEIFCKEFHVTCDAAHRIELVIKDSKQKLIESTSDTIQRVMKFVSCGKPYMELLEQK